MKGLGTNEKEIIEVLTSCNTEQRVSLIKAFKTAYGKVSWGIISCGHCLLISQALSSPIPLVFSISLLLHPQDLIKNLKSELGGHFEDCVIALMRLPEEFDAWSLHKAMAGLGTDESVLIEILATRSNGQIEKIKAKWVFD